MQYNESKHMNVIKEAEFEPKWFVVLTFMLVGVFTGVLGSFIWFFNGGVFELQKIHPGHSKYHFINPLLAVDLIDKKEFLASKPLESKINAVLSNMLSTKNIVQGSVYFRDLEKGRWFGINEEYKFSPGILLKVPLAMAYFKFAESEPSSLQAELKYIGSDSQNGDQITVRTGQRYSVDNLIKSMLIDNNDQAAETLFDNINLDALNEVYSDIGINLKEDKVGDDFINTKQFALIFRILHNATYLSREYSEKMLEILSHADLTADSLTSELPNDIKASHRFRMRVINNGKKTIFEGYSCGIIYYPGHPYILCAMALANKAETINELFRTISKTVYADTAEQYPSN